MGMACVVRGFSIQYCILTSITCLAPARGRERSHAWRRALARPPKRHSSSEQSSAHCAVTSRATLAAGSRAARRSSAPPTSATAPSRRLCDQSGCFLTGRPPLEECRCGTLSSSLSPRLQTAILTFVAVKSVFIALRHLRSASSRSSEVESALKAGSGSPFAWPYPMSGLIALGVGNAVAYTAPSGVCAPGSYSSGVSMQQRSNSWGALRHCIRPPLILGLMP